MCNIYSFPSCNCTYKPPPAASRAGPNPRSWPGHAHIPPSDDRPTERGSAESVSACFLSNLVYAKRISMHMQLCTHIICIYTYECSAPSTISITSHCYLVFSKYVCRVRLLLTQVTYSNSTMCVCSSLALFLSYLYNYYLNYVSALFAQKYIFKNYSVLNGS